MYFCSQGHSSIGGYDVFVSYRNEELGLWGKPINMGYPINTPFDELYFSISANGKKAYFASNRGGGQVEWIFIALPFGENLSSLQ